MTIKPILALSLLVSTPFASALRAEATAAPAPAGRDETAEARDARMAWFRDARFGMFIHWGLYAQAGGFWKGRETKTNKCAEWLQIAGKVPVADYALLAKDFNPVKFDADAWVRAAKVAGMKYLVFTAKHHEGFAMFKSTASPFNIVDATPYKRDVLKDLAEACRRHGVKLGLYYSQNLDWHHAGGGGGSWDPAQKGDPDKYVDGIVIPQLREILTRYGEVSMLWFDIGHGGITSPARSARIRKAVLECNPGIIMNNRLGGGFVGDIETPEQHIPPAGFPGKDWESCMTMNRTWGFAKDDHDWKPARVMIRNLADIASKGGNYLLNVGPDERGEIPAASLERLAEIGEWMQVNGEAIHATRSAGFPALPEWGRITQRADKDGTTTLYAIVFDAPKSGEITLPGLTGAVLGARLLGGTASVKAVGDESGVRVTLPASVRARKDFVIAVRLRGAPVIDATVRADESGEFRFNPRSAVTTGGLREEMEGAAGLGRVADPHLGRWTNPAATAVWKLKASTAGERTLSARIAAPAGSAGSVLEFVLGDIVLPLEIKATGGWNNYETVIVGAVRVPAGESTLTVRVKTKQGDAPCNLAELRLKPVSR